METDNTIKDQLRSSGEAFSVKYIGFIEVATPFHDVKICDDEMTRIALCNGCAALIAQAAGLIPKMSIDPEIQELIGSNQPKFFNKEIELTITSKVMTFFSTDDRKLLKKVEIPNISIAVTVGDTLKNGFVFIGKVKTKTGELKRFGFLLQSQQDPKNIYDAINDAFIMCDPVSSKKNGALSPSEKQQQQDSSSSKVVEEENEKEIFKKPYPPPPRLPEKGTFIYLNVGEKPQSIAPSLKQRRILDYDIKNYPASIPDVIHVAKTYKTADGERAIRHPEVKKEDLNEQEIQGDLYRKSPGCSSSTSSSLYTNVFGDDLAAASFALVNTTSTSLCTAERFSQICQDIEKLPYFFGNISRQKVDEYLKINGSYLIRISESLAFTVILCVRQGIVHHILLNDQYGNVVSDNYNFRSIFHLMAFHTRNNLPFSTEGAIKVYIKHPAVRPGYERI